MSIEGDFAARKAAEQLHATIGGLLCEEVPRLPSNSAREIFWRLMLQSVEKNLPAAKVPDRPAGKKPPRESAASYDEAKDLIEEIGDLAGSICEAGQSFAESVSGKAADILESVEQFGCATDGQLQALENMLNGLQRWFHD